MSRVAMVCVALCAAGCAMPPGMNDRCEWPAETAFAVDAQDSAHRTHLVDDARVVEELVVRHVDAVWGHGPSLEKQNTRGQCFETLFAAVARTHQVTVDDVRQARARLGDNRLDPAVHLPMALLYMMVAFGASGYLVRRFDRDEMVPRVIALALASVVLESGRGRRPTPGPGLGLRDAA